MATPGIEAGPGIEAVTFFGPGGARALGKMLLDPVNLPLGDVEDGHSARAGRGGDVRNAGHSLSF